MLSRFLRNTKSQQRLEQQRRLIEQFEEHRKLLELVELEESVERNAIAHSESLHAAQTYENLLKHYRSLSASDSIRHGMERYLELDLLLAKSHLQQYASASNYRDKGIADDWMSVGDDLRVAFKKAAIKAAEIHRSADQASKSVVSDE